MLAADPVIEVIVRGACILAAWFAGLWVFSWVSLILHEFGHFAAAALVGGRVREIRLGSGPIWRIFEWRHTRLIVHRYPVSGWVAHHRAGNRLQEAVIIFGGPLATGALAYLLWQLVAHFTTFKHSRLLAEFTSLFRVFAMMETAGLFVTLWPSWYQVYGQRVRNDGLLLWNLFFPRPVPGVPPAHEAVAQALCAGQKEEAVRLAREAAEGCESKDYDDYQEFLAGTLVEAGQLDAAAAIYRDLLSTMKPSHPKFREIADNFASMTLYVPAPELFEEAEKWIRDALKSSPRALTLKGTLGGLLVEKGDDDEALSLLRELHAQADTETDLGISAAYLSVLAARSGAAQEVARYREEARKALPGHPLVQRLLAGQLGDVAEVSEKMI